MLSASSILFRAFPTVLADVPMGCREGHLAEHRFLVNDIKLAPLEKPLFRIRREYQTVCTECHLRTWLDRDFALDLQDRLRGRGSQAQGDGGPSGPPVAFPSVLGEQGRYPGPEGGQWYRDPNGPGDRFRLWDGQRWTKRVRSYDGYHWVDGESPPIT